MTTEETAPALAAGNLRGIAALSAGMLCLSISDVMVKLAGATLPVGEIMLLRGMLASLIICVICLSTGVLRNAGQMLQWQVSGRALANVAAGFCYLTALLNMPIADLSAMMQAAPLVLTALAAMLLREDVGWRRWLAIGTGFAGVLLILRPTGEGFNSYALLALAAIFFVSCRDLFTKVVRVETPSILVTLATALATTGGGAVLCLIQGFVPFGFAELKYLVPSAFLLVAGYQLVIIAFRSGEIAVVAPFRFSLVIWATIAGFLVWAEIPDLLTFLGTGLVVGMGVYTFHRERVRSANARLLATDTKREI